MFRKLILTGAIAILVLLIFGVGAYYFGHSVSVKKSSSTLANPASVNCKQRGGELEIRSASDSSQYGICKFNNGTECEEWAYMRGNCKEGQYKIWKQNEPTSDKINQ